MVLEFPTFPDFLETHSDDLFCFWVYRRGYTPYEQKQAFMDESQFEDIHGTVCRVVECIQVSDGKYMIGVQVCIDEEAEQREFAANIDYYNLDEIRLSLWVPPTNNEEDEI